MFRVKVPGSVAVLFIGAVVALPAQNPQPPTAERVDQVLRGIDRGRFIGQVAVSPDGKRLAWIQGARGGMEIRLAPLSDLTKSIRVTAANSPEEHCREN